MNAITLRRHWTTCMFNSSAVPYIFSPQMGHGVLAEHPAAAAAAAASIGRSSRSSARRLRALALTRFVRLMRMRWNVWFVAINNNSIKIPISEMLVLVIPPSEYLVHVSGLESSMGSPSTKKMLLTTREWCCRERPSGKSGTRVPTARSPARSGSPGPTNGAWSRTPGSTTGPTATSSDLSTKKKKISSKFINPNGIELFVKKYEGNEQFLLKKLPLDGVCVT